MKNFGYLSPKVRGLLHGADYNPEQWRDSPETWEEDYRLMKAAGCNVMSVGIFSWTELEPEEGRYDFGWLDEVMDNLYHNGISVILATPSGAKPNWMSAKYPEIRRVNSERVRELPGSRHNHCYTSPVYRDKVNKMNRLLAERYGNHPALIMWHVSNEYEGECHCELCQEAFRNWLKDKYGTLDDLNRAWWTKFWSHTYTDWSQIESPSPIGEQELHGLNLDWKRFITHQTVDFFIAETKPLREVAPDIPVTTNFHDFINLSPGLNLWKFIPHLDIVSWDNYPYWHTTERENWQEAARRGFIHDINRSFMRGKPFMMMESSPSATNWQPVAKLRKPGMHGLASVQAVAHGSDTVQYFQWRKSLGSSEKLHGAVVDHYPTDQTRVFREVAALGKDLLKLGRVAGTSVSPEVAVIYDWENCWALNDAQGLSKRRKEYFDTCVAHYESFWKRGISVDVINAEADFAHYKIVVAPMLYMADDKFGERVEKFVNDGGTFVTTYLSGIVGSTDLCHTCGRPGPLRRVTGVWSEETDVLYYSEMNVVHPTSKASSYLHIQYAAEVFCDLIHPEGCEVLAEYKDDFYAGYPALTVNSYGRGKAYYIAFRSYDNFLGDLYGHIAKEAGVQPVIPVELPEGVTVQLREDEQVKFYFMQNYAGKQNEVNLKGAGKLIDAISGETIDDIITLPPFSYRVLQREM